MKQLLGVLAIAASLVSLSVTKAGGDVAVAAASAPEAPDALTHADLAALQRAVREAQEAQLAGAGIYQQRNDTRAAGREANRQHRRAPTQAIAPDEPLPPLDGAPPSNEISTNQEQPQSQSLSEQPVGQAPGGIADFSVSFKLDGPAKSGSGPADRWVPRISGAGAGVLKLYARAEGRDAAGNPVDISPDWISADPSSVEVWPDHGNAVTITVWGASASNLTVTVPGLSKDLMISAQLDQRNALQVEISQ